MTIYLVREQDWHTCPILLLTDNREAAEMRMMEEGWRHDGGPRTYCEVWELGGSDYSRSWTIGERYYQGAVRRARIRIPKGPFHRVPVDCVRERDFPHKWGNTGLDIVAYEDVPPPQEDFFDCQCVGAVIVEGPQEAWNDYLDGGWVKHQEPEWLDGERK